MASTCWVRTLRTRWHACSRVCLCRASLRVPTRCVVASRQPRDQAHHRARPTAVSRLKSQALTLFDLVERLSLLTRADLRQAGAAQGLQPVHLQVLFYLNQANRFSNTPQALTEYLGLTKGTVSQTVIVLARRRLISRYTDPRDGRVVRLILTEGGTTLLKTLSAGSAWRDIVQTASQARVTSAIVVLRQVLAQVQGQSGKRSFGVCASCRHIQRLGPRSYFCGLMQEKLSSPETRRICREHAPPVSVPPQTEA